MKTAAAFALLAALASAAPTKRLTGPVTVPLQRHQAPEPRTPEESHLRSALHLQTKWPQLLTPEAHAKLDLAKRDGNTGDLTNIVDVTYTADFDFGTPPQKFPVIVDTGSAQFWLYSEECADCGKGFVDTTKSSTFHNTTKPNRQAYGTGETWVSGFFGSDTVGFGGISTENVTVAIMDKSQNMNLKEQAAGISGWSFPLRQKDGTVLDPLPYTQSKNGQWTDKQFGMFLNRGGFAANMQNVTSVRQTGALTVNGLDREFFEGEPEYFPRVELNDRAHFGWGLHLDGVTANGKHFDYKGTGAGAVLDSGTTLIYGPKAQVQEIYKQFPDVIDLGEGLYILPACQPNNTVSFHFGGKEFPIFPADINTFSFFGCQGALTYSDGLEFGDNWLVGDAFLKSYYTAYRYDPPSVGFAKLKEGL